MYKGLVGVSTPELHCHLSEEDRMKIRHLHSDFFFFFFSGGGFELGVGRCFVCFYFYFFVRVSSLRNLYLLQGGVDILCFF